MCIEVVDKEKPAETDDMSKVQEQNDGDGLRIRRIAGGCIISHAPLFSPDGSMIYVVWYRAVRAFSVITGECVCQYEGAEDDIVGIVVNRNDPKVLYGCTRSGLIVDWKTESCVLNNKKEILLNTKFRVEYFNILYDENDVATFLIYGESTKKLILIYCPTKRKIVQTSPFVLENPGPQIMFAPGGDKLNFFAYISGPFWHWATIKPSIKSERRKHCNSVQTKVIACHPTEDIVAVGDQIGRVVLYKHFLQTKAAVPEIYHWHANPVQCVAFSQTGTHFYSGGQERVLVKWAVGKQDSTEMFPRLSDALVHVAVAPENLRVATCMADNGIQIFNALQKQTAVVQSFSKISEDYTGQNPFPIGIRVNPRTQTLIVNGKVGCIQFFSTYTRSMLYTLDITLRNYNTLEKTTVIYNTVVTNVAVNAFWLATVESWNDHCYSAETRLKFWKYDESCQNYVLNTNVEYVHSGGVTGLEFSSTSKERDVLCASAGNDHCVKIWSLEEVEMTGGGEKLVWMCVGRVDYKNLPVRSISFSQDGSLLAGGFGNALCAWSAETLRLKCVLSAPAGYDGGVNRVILSVPTQKEDSISKKEYFEKKSKIIRQMLDVLEQKDTSVPLKKEKYAKRTLRLEGAVESVRKLSGNEQKLVVARAQLQNELTLLQKAELFYHLRIQCRTVGQMREKIAEKLAKAKAVSSQAEQRLHKAVNRLCSDAKFRGKRKLHNYQRRKVTSPGLSAFTSVFDIRRSPEVEKVSPNVKSSSGHPIKATAQIKQVLFCHGEYSHLVVVCTENRLLVWNLLTLRIHVTVNLTVERIVIDSFTNLIAAFTNDNELYIFLPNIPMPLYNRKNLPSVYGAAWIPRRYPKSQSFNVDWQAVSQLYFLNQNQELLHLVSDNDVESLGPVVHMNEMLGGGLPNTPFAAMLAKQTVGSGVQTAAVNLASDRIGVAGKNSVKEIVASSAHTMAPINLLCKDFLKSLLIVEERRRERSSLNEDSGLIETTTVPSDDSESESEATEAADVKSKITARKTALKSIENAKLKPTNTADLLDRDGTLRQLMEESVDIDF